MEIWRSLLLLLSLVSLVEAQTLVLANSRVQDKLVKIYGAGGIRGLEAYQSGFLISETGHLLTAWSYVLDTETVTAVLNDGRRLPAEFVGADPRLEIAVLKVELTQLPYFDLNESVPLDVGDRVLAFSNLYGIASGNEPASLLQGIVSAVTPLAARRGVFETPYDGPAYIVDAMTNNAGAAGGALTDYQGRLAGMLGKELRSSQTNLWLNYAIPISELRESVAEILAGKVRRQASATERLPDEPVTLTTLGIVLLPQILPKTPPYIERIVPGSPADAADLRPDDLIVMVNGQLIQSGQELQAELRRIDRLDPVRLTLLREQQLVNLELLARSTSTAP